MLPLADAWGDHLDIRFQVQLLVLALVAAFRVKPPS
jgi:hypothetical protein